MLTLPAIVGAAEPTATEEGFSDPRRLRLPRTHRARLGLQIDYVRLSAAADADSGETQQFHYAALQLDVAYQAQFLKFVMVRPSLALGGNVANSMEAMPLVIHPQLFTGYQGAILGVAFGYGYFQPLIARQDVISNTRGGLGQPIAVHNHHVGGEVSATTRIDRGALSVQLRMGGVSSRTQHFELDRRRWRFMLSFNAGWYFGTGRKQAERRRERERRRARRRRG